MGSRTLLNIAAALSRKHIPVRFGMAYRRGAHRRERARYGEERGRGVQASGRVSARVLFLLVLVDGRMDLVHELVDLGLS